MVGMCSLRAKASDSLPRARDAPEVDGLIIEMKKIGRAHV